MEVTVAICTWNRARLLELTLQKMRELRIPEGVTWEILVVDNNSTDETPAVIERHAGVLPLRRLFEPRQGHSHARNCAIDAARGKLLAWTDDDVLVDREWLAAYVAAARAWPDAAYFGGPIDPWLEVDLPRWLTHHWDNVKGIFVLRDFGGGVRPLAAAEEPAGANMVFRTEIQRANRFDGGLGRVGTQLTGADDTEIIRRLRDAGAQGVWVGNARVKHFLPAERMTRRFLANWYRGAGRTVVRMNGVDDSPRIFGVPRWALAKALRARARAYLHRAWNDPSWFEAFRESAQLEGYILETWDRRKR